MVMTISLVHFHPTLNYFEDQSFMSCEFPSSSFLTSLFWFLLVGTCWEESNGSNFILPQQSA